MPAGEALPITLDMARSVVAFGKIANMKRQGLKEVPAGWALDENGDPWAISSGSINWKLA